MAKQKACKICKRIYEGSDRCPNCESKEFSDSFKGRISVINPENSELAKNLKISKSGEYAVKT